MITPSEHIDTTDFQSGALLLVDKPQGWTSFDVVNKIRWALRNRLGVKKFKVGHSGTLDPMATGLLLICTGKWTKKLNELQGLDKSYTGTITLGGVTPSFDAETEVRDEKPVEGINKNDIQGHASKYVGVIDQVPPVYSAIKVDGKPLYKSARAGKEVKPDPRQVEVHAFDIVNINPPEVEFEVSCSKGTYIRSLAHDLGQDLGCGGYLTELRRTVVGPYNIEQAFVFEDLITAISREDKQSASI